MQGVFTRLLPQRGAPRSPCVCFPRGHVAAGVRAGPLGPAEKASMWVPLAGTEGREGPRSRACLAFLETELRVSSRRSSELSEEVRLNLQDPREVRLSAC